MKIFLTILFLLSCIFLKAQVQEYWLIDSQTNQKKLVKDSLAAVNYLDSLTQNYYYFTDIDKVIKTGKKTEIYFDKGKSYNQAQVQLDTELVKTLDDQPTFFTKNLDSLKKAISQKYKQQGFVFNRVKSEFKGMKDEIPVVHLSIIKSAERKIDKIVLQGYEKVPVRFRKNIENNYLGKTYQEATLNKLAKSLQNHPFIILQKAPQTLFTQDSTQVFLALQKKKSNSFDGVIGFGNDKTDKFTFNGSLNLNFRNMFNSFETVNIFWQRNPDKGQTFDLQTDIPYLFKSNIGGNFKVNIFRQDSTYANVKLTPALYLHLKNNQKIGVRGTFETSTVLDSLYVQGKDYDKQGVGVWYDYTEPTEIELFLYKTRLRLEADYIKNNYSKEERAGNQTQLYVFGERNFQILGNNYLNIKAETAILTSQNDFAANELLRFGGWNSFRGFNEKSLLADLYYFGTAEYRYLVGNQAFFDVFGQYGEFHNRSLGLKPKIYSFGAGFNFFLPIGLMSFQVSNGNEFGNAIKLSDTKIHWGILSRF